MPLHKVGHSLLWFSLNTNSWMVLV